ncbi:avidin/streptavidin family protein [Mesorhizobium sp.]|uniref:avidin/streptavidin family protein n=1 Tax=Mesorhizobium sp. TaxID=1871066 RepID=UPI000FE778E1|nr:avidin/streptavidin family protein [Mesorhizobium sp.]RWM29387.1 MAG: hypothetical protein EOR74_06825 [Mesorhizobium sp.]
MRIVALSVASVLFGSQFASADDLPPNSTWKNQRGSVLTVSTVDANKKTFSGNFVNNATGSDPNCMGGNGFPVDGILRDDGSLVFTVVFTPCETITVWHGKLASGVLSAPWVLAYPIASGVLVNQGGEDTFTKQ